jgi:hypothetical protein
MPRKKEKEAQPSPAALPKTISSSTTSTGPLSSPQTLRRRLPAAPATHASQEKMINDEARSTASVADEESATFTAPDPWTSRNQWIVFAVASGACAAFNGVFAKLSVPPFLICELRHPVMAPRRLLYLSCNTPICIWAFWRSPPTPARSFRQALSISKQLHIAAGSLCCDDASV